MKFYFRNIMISLFFVSSFSSYSNQDSIFLSFNHPKSYKVLVKNQKNEKYSELYRIEILHNNQLVEEFSKCQGGLLPIPERGYYRIYCRKQNSSFIVSGRFDHVSRFTGLWTNPKGEFIKFTNSPSN